MTAATELDPGLQAALHDYLDTGSDAALTRLHRRIAAEPTFTPDAEWVVRTRRLVEQERWDEVIRLLESTMPGSLFCPAAHAWLSAAYAAIDDPEAAERERRYAYLSTDAVLGSGEGSHGRPWRVLRPMDAYAALDRAGITPGEQRLIVQDERAFDVIDGADGREHWFELAVAP